MIRSSLLALGLTFAAAAAADADPANTDADGSRWRMSLDANQDGYLDRSEAAASARFAGKFDQLDRDRDGRLSAEELAKSRGQRRRGGVDSLARLDVDGDGRLSRSELAGSTRLAPKFALIDGNRDGYVQRSELRDYLERTHAQRRARFAQRSGEAFAAADLNRDGRLSRVEVSETLPRLVERFSWMDDNRDGFLSRQELQSRER